LIGPNVGATEAMSEEFASLTNRFLEHMQYVDEETLVVLKGLLLIEEILNNILEQFVFHIEFIGKANLRFAQKCELARSLSLDEHQNSIWELVTAYNTLRNELAHKLDSRKRQAKIDMVKALYFKLCSDRPDLENQRTLEDKIILSFAAALCLGFLSTFEREARRFRSWVDQLDPIVNPHRHESERGEEKSDSQ
jgi:hypothetical protein